MNKIFKKVWNKRRGCFVAVSEAMTAASQNTGKAAVITAGLALALASTPSYAIYKHIYAGESTAGQNLDYAEQDYSLNLHGNYTVGAGSNVSWSVRGRAAFNIGPDNTVTTVNGNLLLHSWNSGDLGHFTWDRSNSILVNSTGSLYIGDYDEIGNLTRGGTNGSNNLTEFRLKDSSSITINGRGFSNTTFVQEGNSVLSINGSGMVFDGPFHINGNSRVDVHNNLQTRSNTYMTGGTINPYGNWINTGSFNLQGGNVNAGNGSLINNGTVTQTGGNFSSKLTGSGTYNYNGGSFNASKVSGDIIVNIASGLGASTSNFEGGNINNRGTLTVNGGWYKNLNNYGTANFNGNATIAKTTNYGTINSYGAVNFTDKLNTSGTLNTHDGVWSFGPSGVLAVSGGIVQTNNIFNVFDSLGTTAQQELHYVGLNSVLPQEVKSSLNDFFTKYAPGSIAQKLINHASFTGGKIVITGVNLTQTQADDLAKAFKTKFGSATTLEFQGTIAGVSHDDKLTVAKTNELYDNVEHLRDVIFVDRKLEAENGAVVVGNSGLRNNTGFTGINEATGTTIQDGKELTLIGGKSDGSGNRFNLAEKVISAVGDGAKLILGSLGIKDSSLYQGQAAEVNLSNGGELKITAGDYLVRNHSSAGGTTTVDKNSTFRSDNATFTDKAVLENNGETILGALNGWNSAEVRNNSKLTVNGNTQFGGRFINNANAKLVGTADIDGTLQNSQGARLIANTVNVNGTLRNFGYMEALDNSTVFGTLENPGEIRLFNTHIGSRGSGDIGTIGNTYTLKATGKTQVSGLLANAPGAIAEFSGNDSELVILSGGSVSNNGTLIADSLVVNEGGYFINGDNAQKTFTASPLRLRAVTRAVAKATEQLKNLTVSEGGTKTNNGLAYYGTGSIAGEFINAAGAEAYGGVSDIFADGSGLGITNTGSIRNAGTFTFGGSLNNSGSITGDGLIVFKRAGLGNDTFTNAGQINVGSLEADNIKYVQTAGSLSSPSGWFSNSTVELTGGTIEHAVLGSGNTYNLGSGSGSNDAATFTVGTLDSSSVVNINRGATLRTEKIAMTGHKTTNLQGGRLSTTLNQVFADLDYRTLNLDAANPDDKVEVSSNPQIVTGVGNVIDSVAEGIAYKWGTVAFDDASYSAALAGDAVNKLVAIGDVPADRHGELEVAFNGKAAERFNVDLANSIKATANGGQAYATFANETLSNESAANPGATSLVVGVNDRSAVIIPTSGKPNVLNQNMGFMNVTGVTDGLYINNGSHFVLVGQEQPNPNLAPVELADGTVWVGGNKNIDGSVTPSKLTLGSYGSASETKGHLGELNIGISPANPALGGAGGQVIVKNGEFTVDVLNNGSAGYGNDREGLVIGNAEDTTTQLIVTNYTAVDGSAMSNHGIFKAENIASRNTNNSFVNHGTFEIGSADVSGYIENDGKADFKELTLREYGTVNRTGGELTAGKLTVSGNALAGASGTYAIRGSLENQGKLSVTEELTVAGDMTNGGELDIAKLTVQAATPVQDAKAGSFINNALAKVDSLLTEAGSLVSNAADAVLTIAGLNGASELNGTVTNDGTLKVDGTQSVTVASGELNNNGSMENTNALNVEGGLVNNKGNLALTGLNITGGQVSNDASAYFKDAGVTEIAMSDTGDVAIQNGGLLDLTDLQLTKGTISGGTVGVKETTIASVKADGVIDAASVGFKDLTNEGVITVSDVFASANTENSGTVDAANIAMSDGDKFVNKAGATATSDKLDLAGGEFVNEAGDTSGIALTQIGENGQFTANGDTTLQQVGSAGGTINLNKGNLNIAELDAKDSVYNQTAGNFKADKGFFENSTLNIMGGVFDASEVRDAEGNVTGLLGNNVVNISGPNKTPVINNEDSAEDKAHYKDNLTQVLAGVVNSDTTVNIMEGGVLDVAEIKLDGTKADSINLKGGVLQTSADQIFGSVTTEAIRIDAADPETGTVQLPTEVLSATTVGAVKDEIKTGLNVESGNLALDDDWFSSSLIVSVTDKIANAFENAANLTINFLGQMTAPFTVTTANDLEKEGLDVVLNPGIVLNTTTLHNEFADEYNKGTDASQTIKGLIIGAESNDPNTNSINISMGFKDVSHTDKVTIEGGKELVLVGNAVNAIPEGSFGDDANKLLKDSADGGSIDVNNGTFTFGSHGGVTPTVGWILSSNIGENGALEAKNGEFADWTIANNGNVYVHSNAILHTNSLTGNGSTVNEGKLSLDEKDGNAPVFDVVGSFLNKGPNSVLDASKVDQVSVYGTHVNEGNAEYHDMMIAPDGSSNNSGTEKGNILTVQGSHANSGTSIWNGVTVADKGKGENAGKLDVGSVFDVLGEFVNKGAEAVLDATKTAVTNVAGILRNEGTANYDDMTIADGGKSENAGFEKGDILTVATGAEHSNSGTSIWNNVTVQDGATSTVEEGAKETINDAYVVAGDRTNKGEVDATGVENTQVTGTLDNQGTSNYDDMTVASGGTSNNSGYEKGDILIIEDGGEHINSGTSIWNNQTVQVGGSATTEEGGKETINDKYVIEGDKTNRGEVDAKGVENTEVKGNLDNQGKSEYDDMTIGDGGKSDNSGYEKGDILTIDKGGEHDNSGTSIWNNVVVAGGDVNNTGDIETEKLTIDDGLVNIGEGSLNAGETDLNGGDLVIGNDKDRTPENRVTAEINPKNDVIDTNIYVKNNGDLNLGPKGGLDWADSIGSPTVPGGTPSRLVITTNVTTGPGGGIAVGPEVWTDKDNHVQIGNGDLYFAKDSLTVIDSSILTDGKSAFNTTSDVAKVTVEPGANLVLGNIEEVGDYTIVNGYITGGNESDGMWTGGWTGDNLYALPQDGSGINWILKLHNDPSKIWVNATLADVRTVYPDIAIPNIANDDMLNCKSGDPGADFVCRVLRDKELDVAGKTKILNSVANIAFAGGAMSVAMNDLNSATDSIEGRVSMKNEAFTEYGVMREWERGNDLWIDVIGGKQKYKSLSATGISKAGYDTNSYGFVMGYDRKFADKPIILGAAFSYNHGSLDSTGDVLKTKNKYNSFGLHAYGAYAPVEKVNLIGTLSWMHNSSDITQSINAAGFNKADADVKTNMFSLGARAEATIPAGTANIVPHAGLRYVWAKSGKYDTKVDGKKVWSNKADATNTFQLPIGVAVRTDIATASGWNVRPQADVTVIPQFGDTKQKTKLSNFNGVSDKLSGEFAGKFGTNVNLGVQADKGPATIGVRYGFTGGTKGKADHMFKLEARYRF
ncbi:ESPR-type extended signal peptide-containing protein [Parasutterella excrementihominis]|uniref:ESPR-type extended signal peptide-containing protein n=1 Tax=Parasutterella excrementihominis TaxID=487175 RepID=UPI003AACFB79